MKPSTPKPTFAWASVLPIGMCRYAEATCQECKNNLPDDKAIRVWIVPADGSNRIVPVAKRGRKVKR